MCLGVLGLDEAWARTALLLGDAAITRLTRAHVWVFGAGGVGSYCIEALVRAGIGCLTVVDGDVVDATNCNRQLIADRTTLGQPKVQAVKTRAERINPDIQCNAIHKLFLPDCADEFDFSDADFVVDAVDMVTAKIGIIQKAIAAAVPVISCMGTGNKLDPSRLEVTDLYKTNTDPLARVMRRELKRRGILSLPVVCSNEPPIARPDMDGKRPVTASVPWVPSVAGLMAAGYVVRTIVQV